MVRHDLRCRFCDAFYANITVDPNTINQGCVYPNDLTCKCGSVVFYITWESGEAPKGYVQPDETIGRLWDKAGLDPTSERSRKAAADAIRAGKRKAS